VFLFVCSVRAGLMALRATTPLDIKRLATYTIRVMRMNFMLNNIIVGVLGVGSAVIAVLAIQPELVQQLRENTEDVSFRELKEIFTLVGQLPFFVFPMIALGFCVSIGANGGSIAASAASAAARGPNHDMLFGLARQFLHLFMLGFLLLMVPLLVIQNQLGGLSATIADAYNLGIGFVIGAAVYFGWTICAVAAGMAISYVLTLSDDDLAKIQEVGALMGTAHAPDDIRALRQARQDIIDGNLHDQWGEPEETPSPTDTSEALADDIADVETEMDTAADQGTEPDTTSKEA